MNTLTSTSALPPPSLSDTPRVNHTVLVPCFLQVEIPADDELEAEVLATEAVRKMGAIQDGGVKISYRSQITAIVDLTKNPS